MCYFIGALLQLSFNVFSVFVQHLTIRRNAQVVDTGARHFGRDFLCIFTCSVTIASISCHYIRFNQRTIIVFPSTPLAKVNIEKRPETRFRFLTGATGFPWAQSDMLL